MLPKALPFGISLLILAAVLPGCKSTPGTNALHQNTTPDPSAVSDHLRAISARGNLPDLRWPDFADNRDSFQKFYESQAFAPVWIRSGQVTPQALALIQAFEDSKQKGLNPEDYDASRWPAHENSLKASPLTPDSITRFDAALTVSAIRYLSDLNIGRANPSHPQFAIEIDQANYDLPNFLAQKVIAATNMNEALDHVEPQYYGYQRTESALKTYIALAARDNSTPLSDLPKSTSPGEPYTQVDELAKRLKVRADLPESAVLGTPPGVYGGVLATAVKHFQLRHGIKADGKLGKETLRQLNTPLSARVTQLEDALERWRWLPHQFSTLPVAVNLPEFVLRTFSPDHHVALRMNVVVGKAFGHQTPVFAKSIKYIIFRPYWNIPPSIVKSEIVPGLQKSGSYLTRKQMEITDSAGHILTSGAVSATVLRELRSGRLMVRQKPGPRNSLGLIKFMFPNEFNVYLHSTPAQQLFAQSRRDFSHGCIRIQQPAELAAFLLANDPKWTLDHIKEAMASGPDNQQVNLVTPIPVVIVYMTAVVEEDDELYFFDDIYGEDTALNEMLQKRRPYNQ